MAQISCTKCGFAFEPGTQQCTNCGIDIRLRCRHCERDFVAIAAIKEGAILRCPRCGGESDAVEASRYTGEVASFPVTLSIEYSDQEPSPGSSLLEIRLFLFVRLLLAIPLYIGMYFYGWIAGIAVFFACWAILFTGRLPMGLFSFVMGFMQYQYKVFSYFPLFLTNWWAPDESHPVEIKIHYPDSSSRLVMAFLKLPSLLLNIVFNLTVWAFLFLLLLAVPAWGAILVTGRYPKRLFVLSTKLLQWQFRVTVW